MRDRSFFKQSTQGVSSKGEEIEGLECENYYGNNAKEGSSNNIARLFKTYLNKASETLENESNNEKKIESKENKESISEIMQQMEEYFDANSKENNNLSKNTYNKEIDAKHKKDNKIKLCMNNPITDISNKDLIIQRNIKCITHDNSKWKNKLDDRKRAIIGKLVKIRESFILKKHFKMWKNADMIDVKVNADTSTILKYMAFCDIIKSLLYTSLHRRLLLWNYATCKKNDISIMNKRLLGRALHTIGRKLNDENMRKCLNNMK